MKQLSMLAATLGAILTLPATAQVEYAYNWHTPNSGFSGGIAAFSGPGLFGAITGQGNYGGEIRVCYGIDDFQGGRNEDGFADITWMRLVGAYAPNNSLQAMEFGLTSVSSATVDSLDGDACFSPFFGQPGVSLATDVATAFNFGTIAGTGGNPFPTFWFVSFQFLGSSGLQVANRIGTDSEGLPLLANVIFEVQSPVNAGPLNNYYYLATTSEMVGAGENGQGTGGVTNGNAQQGHALSGVTADLSAAYVHYRLSSLGTSTFGISFGSQSAESIQFFGALAAQTPFLWAANDGNTGAGGADLRIGSAPVSTFQWRVIDIRSGAEGAGGPTQPGTAISGITDPNLTANLAVTIYSVTPAATMLQQPMSWDDLGGAIYPQPGSSALRKQVTKRAGKQTVPANVDLLMASFLQFNSFTVGTDYLPAYDGTSGAVFENGVGIGISGSSNMPIALPVASTPNPQLVGAKIGMAALGLQYDSSINAIEISEIANGLTLNLQP